MLSTYLTSNNKSKGTVLHFTTYIFNTAIHEILCAWPPRYTTDTILPFFANDDPCIAEALCLAEEIRCIAHLRTIASQERSEERYGERRRHVIYTPRVVV
ncbi:hypothetical protein V5799_020757 [Amblyomma americanum]|uniref:Uncharacterized protein n=1 Tax=Amblyomma americanum TaxID=6943 RepID=A0AAQ4ETU1_AMBAM